MCFTRAWPTGIVERVLDDLDEDPALIAFTLT
jgi:hypothetical protein